MLIIAPQLGMANYYIDIANKHVCNCIVNFVNIVSTVMPIVIIVVIHNVAH